MQYDFLPNVSVKNEVLSLRISAALQLVAGVWTERVEDTLTMARLNCLHHALSRLKENWPDWELCLLAAHKPTQPDNRLTRCRGFWKSLAAGGMELPQGDFIKESIIVVEGGIRGFGAATFELNQLEAIHSIMLTTQAAIAFTTSSAVLTKMPLLITRGWPLKNTKPPEEIVELICDQSGIVIDAYGAFDDREAIVAAIGRKEVLSGLEP